MRPPLNLRHVPHAPSARATPFDGGGTSPVELNGERSKPMIHRSITKFTLRLVLLLAVAVIASAPALAQALGSAGTVTGVITDPNGAVVPSASVTISNPITGYTRTVNTEADGTFRFNDVPPNNYHLSISATGFGAAQQDLAVRQSVPISLKIPLTVGGATETVTVTSVSASEVLENVPTTHTDVGQLQMAQLPERSPGSGLRSEEHTSE